MQIEDNLTSTEVQDDGDLASVLDGVLDEQTPQQEEAPKEAIADDVPEEALSEPQKEAKSTEEQPVEPEKVEEAETPAEDVSDVPQHWPPQYRDAFKAAPAGVRQAWLNHQKDMQQAITRSVQEGKEARQTVDAIESHIPPALRQEMDQSGVSTAQGVKRLTDLYEWANQDPQGYIAWFQEQMGMSGAGEDQQFQQTNQNTQQFFDPRVDQMLKAQQEQVQQQSTSAIASFRNAVNEAGEPVNPYFEDVKDDMSWIIANDPQLANVSDMGERLKMAYEKAVYSNPAIREKVLAEKLESQRKAEQAKREAERAAKASSVTGSPAPAPTNNGPIDLDSAVSESIAAVSG